MAFIVGTRIFEDNKKNIDTLWERGFGEASGSAMVLAPVEALYLLEKKKITLTDGGKSKSKGKKLSFSALMQGLKKVDKEIGLKYLVYRDLRSNGYVVRTGLKYGTHFRVYEKGVRVGEGHSHWLIQPISEEWKTSIYELAKSIRLAHSVRKKMIWAVADTEGDITYYKLERIVI